MGLSLLIRMWINTPSKIDPLHHLHGKNVLTNGGRGVIDVWFTEGDVISMRIPYYCLAKGWKENV